ncbi:MAG: hypothetical protein KJO39_10720 [Bacteroidia bacterium]|nr:hypothetical protein [Bacteroidia bacterium]MBT8276608.1 hypothetical protein [Bacteroidia bacterium]NNM08299.1 hypothetical protein [Flavobacteriaceae bacterium]
MKTLHHLTLLTLISAFCMQAQTLTGTYNGNIDGTPATLTLQQEGVDVSGQINANGYLYNLSGKANGSRSQGTLTDSQTQGVMNYEGSLNGNSFSLSLNTGGGSPFVLQFTKGNAPTGKSGGSSNTNTDTVSSTQLDQRIVGNWLYTDSYTSGEYSFASQYRLIVNSDGTYLYGDGKVAGGGPGVSGTGGEGSGMSPGKWKTENSIIYINEGYGWQAYAKYYVEGTSMMLTFGDGSKQVWKRSY